MAVTAARIAEGSGGSRTLKRPIRTMQDFDRLIASARMPREAVARPSDRLADQTGIKYRIVPRSTYNRVHLLSELHRMTSVDSRLLRLP